MNFQYKINDAFLGIRFDFTPSQIKAALGEPDSIESNYYNSTEYDETYFYSDKVRIIFCYEDGRLNYLSIFTKSMFVEEQELFKTSKIEVLDFFSNLSSISVNDAKNDELIMDDHVFSEEYRFGDIGVTLWFEGDVLDEICLFSPS